MVVHRGPGAEATFANGVQTAIFDNESSERDLYTITIPGNTLKAGDLLRVHFLFEIVAIISGTIRFRMRMNGVALDGFLEPAVAGPDGFEFAQLGVVDTGGGMALARFTSGTFTDVDIVDDATSDLVFTFTGQPSIADAGNRYRGMFAYVRIN